MKLNKNFWSNRYQENQTGWDIGYPSPAITKFFDTVVDKDKKILIPGAGNCYEGEYLFRAGFKNVFILDLAAEPLANFQQRVPEFPEAQLLQGNFFEHQTQYDFIVEQTFFCALNPSLRKNYVMKMADSLYENGALVGLLFNIPLHDDQPPFGGSKAEYEQLFAKHFQILKMETAYNSIKPRAGNELFIWLRKG